MFDSSLNFECIGLPIQSDGEFTNYYVLIRNIVYIPYFNPVLLEIKAAFYDFLKIMYQLKYILILLTEINKNQKRQLGTF